MAYVPIQWLDEVVEHPHRYTEVLNEDGTVEHTLAPGTTYQAGTPLSAANLNHMDAGIKELDTGKVDKTDPLISLDTNAAASTVDGKLYAALTAIGWASDVIEP